jgi:hypothetical protein
MEKTIACQMPNELNRANVIEIVLRIAQRLPLYS